MDAETCAITDVNPFPIKMLGYSREEFMEKKLWEVGQKAFEALQKNEYIRYDNLPLRMKSGKLIDKEDNMLANSLLIGSIISSR